MSKPNPKRLRRININTTIPQKIEQDLRKVSPKPIQDFRLISAKSGVHVYNCLYDGTPAVAKYFENEDDRREILNYRILARHDIPTIKTFALGKAAFVMEDITLSQDWRLGIKEDFTDTDVAKSLARWYFIFHETGETVPELRTLFFEFDSITKENLEMLIQKLPVAEETFNFILAHYGKLRELINMPSFTLTYNDFHWSNFIVRKDKKAAMMFDYNLMGKGYRASDFSNVCWGISAQAKAAFVSEYNRLYVEKHGHDRTAEEKAEQRIDDVAGPVYALIVALTCHGNDPNWGKDLKDDATSGNLLAKAKQLLM